jgi:hypothetical protein
VNDPAPSVKPGRIVWLRAGAAALAVALLAAAAPLIWTAVAAGLGLVAMLIVVAAGLAALHALPYAGQLLENGLLQARLRAARSQPIAQMRNQLLHRARQLLEFRAALTTIHAQIEGMQDMLEARRARDPRHDLAKHEAALQKMSAFYAGCVHKLSAAECALEEYERHIEAKLFEHDFSRAGQVVLTRLNASDPEEILRGVLADEASRAIQTNFNRVFAELELERHRLPAVAASSDGLRKRS